VVTLGDDSSYDLLFACLGSLDFFDLDFDLFDSLDFLDFLDFLELYVIDEVEEELADCSPLSES
jgi:hypothetical protein